MIDTVVDRLGYAVEEIAAHGDDPEWWHARAVHRLNGPFQRRVARDGGINVVAADWDVLVVLDGCRADLFEEAVGTGDGRDDATHGDQAGGVGSHRGHAVGREHADSYRRVRSRASQTAEWLRTSFPETYGDTVYVAGNPMVSLCKPNVWYHLEESWREGFDPDLGTIAAPQVTADALAAREANPEKRLVVHYIQPHYPFVGFPELHFSSFETFHEVDVELDGDERASSVWDALGKDLVAREDVWRGYRANLEYVLEETRRLCRALAGERVVVTADHGNLLGERLWPVPVREYGHPPGLRVPGLVEVPWAIREGEARPTITAGSAGSCSAADEDRIDQRLSALGYA